MVKALSDGNDSQMRMIDISSMPHPPSTIESSLQPIAEESSTEQTPLIIDPDKDIDSQLITYYDFLKPSELLKQEDRNECIEHYIPTINKELQSFDGRIKNKKEGTENYKRYRRFIDGLRTYRYRIKQIPEAVRLMRMRSMKGQGLRRK